MADDLSDKKSELSEYAAPEIKETDIDEKGDEATSDTTSDLEVVHDGAGPPTPSVFPSLYLLSKIGMQVPMFRDLLLGAPMLSSAPIASFAHAFLPTACVTMEILR